MVFQTSNLPRANLGCIPRAHSEAMTFVARLPMYSMGLLTWVIIAVVVLAIIGLGVGTFYSGILQGAQTVGSNPVVEDATGEARESADNITRALQMK